MYSYWMSGPQGAEESGLFAGIRNAFCEGPDANLALWESLRLTIRTWPATRIFGSGSPDIILDHVAHICQLRTLHAPCAVLHLLHMLTGCWLVLAI